SFLLLRRNNMGMTSTSRGVRHRDVAADFLLALRAPDGRPDFRRDERPAADWDRDGRVRRGDDAAPLPAVEATCPASTASRSASRPASAAAARAACDASSGSVLALWSA